MLFVPQLALRQDVGAIFENFMIIERIKYNHYSNNLCNYFFWRTHSQQEIDFIEEYDGKLFAHEFKWNMNKKVKAPASFSEAYPESGFALYNPHNFEEFLMTKGSVGEDSKGRKKRPLL